MNRMWLWRVGIVGCALILLSILSTGCQKDRSSKATTTIGLITPLSGEISDLGAEILTSANLAIERANANESGPTFRLVVKDDALSGVTASTAATSLVSQENAVAIVGAGVSSVVMAEIEALRGRSIPLLTPTATASSITDGVDFVFRVIPPNRAQGESLANFAVKTLGSKTAAIVFQRGDDYSEDLKEAFKKAFTSGGGSIELEVGFEGNETDFRVLLNLIRSKGVDVIVSAAQHVPVSRIVVRAKEIGLDVPFLSGETAFTDKLLSAAGASAEGLYVTGAALDMENPTTQHAVFIEAYTAKTGKAPGIYGIYTYDAIGLLTHVLSSGDISTSGALLDALKSAEPYEGVTGTIDFNERGDVAKEYKIFRVEGGKFVAADTRSSS